MLELAMTCMRHDNPDQAVLMVAQGNFTEAVRLAMMRLEKKPTTQTAASHALLGQVIGRTLIALGREADAEELFRQQLRIYELASRSSLRWMSALDHGAISVATNRLARAADAFNMVADDDSAPTELRIEGLAGLAVAMRGLGEYRRADRILSFALALSEERKSPGITQLLNALRLETNTLGSFRTFDDPDSIRHATVTVSPSIANARVPLRTELQNAASQLTWLPIASDRLNFLASLIGTDVADRPIAKALGDAPQDGRQPRAVGYELDRRVEAALASASSGEIRTTQDILAGLVPDEEAIQRHRYSLELKYCLSRVYAHQGRYADALRLYKEHALQALHRLRMELSHLPHPRCLEELETADNADPMKLLLPLRYRRAYQYIVEHLRQRDLSIREVASHVNVTERALQMAFRTHLGLTPAELIRRKRMEHIRQELRDSQDRRTVLDVGQKWGLSSRSTLTHSYRRRFNETPTTMMRGGAAPAEAGAGLP